ncbi:MAG: GyrI-like domain-containing protein [Bacillus subtilis]|nr:GyrI-like domain-containing protein [Bacillus subtilis]
MKIEHAAMPSFAVIGLAKFGPRVDAPNWIRPLWVEANHRFPEIAHLALTDEAGRLAGFWGAMSDVDLTFSPWGETGWYLAGVQANLDATPPEGWTKWIVPAFDYVYGKVEGDYRMAMSDALEGYLPEHKLRLAGAIQEYYCPEENGQLYLFFPVQTIKK